MRYQYMDEEEGDIYLIWLYFAITSLTTVGYGDISAFTTAEMIIAMLAALVDSSRESEVCNTVCDFLNSHTDETAPA